MATRSEWMGGKPAGWVNDVYKKGWCQIAFSSERNIPSICYTYTHHGGRIETLRKAEAMRKQISDEHGLTKNLYRYVTEPSGEVWVEVQLQEPDLLLQCEVNHLHLVEERIWTAHIGIGKKVHYAKSRESKKREQTHALFHSIAYPEYAQIDHIDRNGLNNRRMNIRDGSGRINANNKGKQKNNTSGITGVYKDEKSWSAQWVDKDGKRHRKRFSINAYGDDEAKSKAIAYRTMEVDKCRKALGVHTDTPSISTSSTTHVSTSPTTNSQYSTLCLNDDNTLTEFGNQILIALKEEYGPDVEFDGNRVRYKKTRVVNRVANSVPIVRRMVEAKLKEMSE